MFEVEDFYTFEMDGKIYNEKMEDGLFVLKPSWIARNLEKFDKRWLHISCFDKQPYMKNEHFKIYHADSVKILGNIEDGLVSFMDCRQNTYGFMNELNQIVFPAVFSNIHSFKKGSALVTLGDEQLYLTKDGQLHKEKPEELEEQPSLFSENELIYLPTIKNGQVYLAREGEEISLPYSFRFDRFKFLSSHFMMAFSEASQYFVVKTDVPMVANDVKEDNFVRNRIIGLAHMLTDSKEGVGISGDYVYDIFQNKIKAITNLQRNIRVRSNEKELIEIVDDDIKTADNFQLIK